VSTTASDRPGPQHCETLVRGQVITMDPARRVLSDGWVTLGGGMILEVGSGPCAWTADEELGGPEALVMPGLVNTHTHLVQGCIRSMAEGTRFEERLFGFYYPMTGAADEDDSYWSALPPVLDLLRSGVTTTTDDHFSHQEKDSMTGVLRAMRDAGIRGRAARLMVNDPNAVPEGLRETIDGGLAETDRLAAAYDSDTLSVTASTIGITYVSTSDLHDLNDWTLQHGKQFDIHAPSMMDAKYLAETRGWTGGSIEWLASEKLLAEHVIAIHAQHLRPGEAALLGDAGASVSLVPDMELILGMVTFDSRQYLDAGVTMSLGLDGPVVSYGHNLWMGMRGYLMAQRIGDSARKLVGGDKGRFGDELLFGLPENALELATIGGATALGLQDRIGSLEPGKEADLIVVDLASEPTLAPRAALLANLVWSGGPAPSSISEVLVRGRTVMRRGVPVDVDLAEAIGRSNEVQAKLLVETGSDRFVNRGTRWSWQ
jgi:5-methylthioadenosine/S-adenosylhomocysteine deaminase